MIESKNEKFNRMMAVRLPKAIKAIELLSNLSRKSDYEWTQHELQSMTDQLDDAVDSVLSAFGVAPAPEEAEKMVDTASEPAETPADPKFVEVVDRSEVKWAYDALLRSDVDLAKNRLARVLTKWIAEGL